MTQPPDQTVKSIVETIARFSGGDTAARVGALPAGSPLEPLRAQLNELLQRSEEENENFHQINMSMADALTDWFGVLSEAKSGNLGARVSASYGDEFLDKLGNQINDTLVTLKAIDEERTHQRQQIVDQQAKLIQELSTPIIQVWDQVLALPVVGIVDSVRAQEMMEKLLDTVVANQAKCVIIDLTGVTMMDTKTADYLIKMVKASTLVGSKCIITGIGPAVAQTITRMGLDLTGITTLRDLRDGLKQAFQDMNVQVVTGSR
jgi:anti-anti-sigma regulatory factor